MGCIMVGRCVFAWVCAVISLVGSNATAQDDCRVRAQRRLRAAASAYRRADFSACAREAAGLGSAGLLNPAAALYLAAQCSFYDGAYKHARKRFAQLAKRHPDSPFATVAGWRVGDCLWALDRRAAAVAVYKRMDSGGKDPLSDPAVGLARRALHRLSMGQSSQGNALWIALRRRFANHPLAQSAPPGHPEPRLALTDALAVARSLHQTRRWQAALDVLDCAPAPTVERDRFELAFLAGRILFDMRFRYERAADLLLAARDHAPGPEQAEEAWFYGSRALGRADLDGQAIASHLAMVAKYPRGRYADRALFYSGWLEYNQGRSAKALSIFARVMSAYPKGRWAREAAWFAAWCHLRRREWHQAITVLRDQLDWPGFRFGGRARYWTGVAQLRLGRQQSAAESFRRIIGEHPLTWYSLLARIRLGAAAPPWPEPPRANPLPAVRDRLLARAEELTDADLGGLATLVLRQREKRFLARHPGRAGRLALMDAYRRAGDFHRPWYLSLTAERRALDALPNSQTRAIWDHAYPACERKRLRRHAGDDQALVLFLQAIMRTESGFDPDALSVANARGLMQMIPPTAVRVAAELRIPDYSDDGLFDPELNIRTAAWYIGALVAKFKRQWPLAAAAFNAGPQPAMDWCRKNGQLQLDAFVEAVPYTESRRYAKRVLTAFIRYALLEGRPLPELRLELDCDILDIEPNY